ncbi:raffinose/stachyose/melibiose transport system substrate-binding protein [Thermomonospora echinospora]|uniref:Raffinose/stachyose/melibiose transport system substrate-binding protein n=1 Tax=Thermomonospora echinospora TaxID=1992 RepID=A0A1H6D131_9ACTN|nr:ABC transporter substrate-binding protein [Thermomonospora echinospora]SEG78738.1 raffinose/stachyose/melibiose transport system substrate-binding protein [Thermomonospora echinospora]
MSRGSRILACGALLVPLLAAGCANEARDADTLEISTISGGPNDPIDTVVREFRAANPGITVTVKKVPFDQHLQGIRRRLSTGRPPDVVTTLPGYGESSSSASLADKGLLLDLSASPWSKEILEADRRITGDGTRTFVYPVSSQAVGTFYDPKVLAREGLSVPTTFSEVLTLCRTVARKGKVAFAMTGQEGAGLTIFVGLALAASDVFADDPRFGERRLAGQATFAGTAGWARSMEHFQQMKDAGCFDKGAAGSSREAAAQAFAKGEALMAVGTTVTLQLFQAGDANLKLKMFPFPGSDDPAKVRIPIGPAVGLVVPKKAGNPGLAKKFLDFYAAGRERYARLDASVPAIPVRTNKPDVPDYAEALRPYLQAGKTAPIMDQHWPNPEVHTQYASGLTEILLGKKDPGQTLKAMDAAWTERAP